MPPDPLEPLLFSICFKMILPEHIRLKIQYVKIWCPPWKISECAIDMKTLFKELLTPFLGLTSLHLVNIQSKSKFHSPHRNFLDPLLSAGSRLFFRTSPLLKYAGSAPDCRCNVAPLTTKIERCRSINMTLKYISLRVECTNANPRITWLKGQPAVKLIMVCTNANRWSKT